MGSLAFGVAGKRGVAPEMSWLAGLRLMLCTLTKLWKFTAILRDSETKSTSSEFIFRPAASSTSSWTRLACLATPMNIFAKCICFQSSSCPSSLLQNKSKSSVSAVNLWSFTCWITSPVRCDACHLLMSQVMWLRGRLLFLSFCFCFFVCCPFRNKQTTKNACHVDGSIPNGRDDRLHVIDPGLQVRPTRTKDLHALWHRLQLQHGLQHMLRLRHLTVTHTHNSIQSSI